MTTKTIQNHILKRSFWGICLILTGLAFSKPAQNLGAPVELKFSADVTSEKFYFRPWTPGDHSRTDADWSATWFKSDILTANDTNTYKANTSNFNYITREIYPEKTGNYTFGIDSATGLLTDDKSDTQIWIYADSFDPLDPLKNVVAVNEDIDYDIDGNLATKDGNWLSKITDVPLTAKSKYILVITTFTKGQTGTVYFTASGPGFIVVGDPEIVAPTVQTNTAQNITSTSALLAGKVVSAGGDLVSERGVLWSLDSNVSIFDNKVSMGSGVGNFSQNVNSLPKSKLIYYRAYAQNSGGIALGAEKVLSTFIKDPQTINFGSFADVQLGVADLELKGVASSGLKVSYTSSDTTIAKISNDKVQIVGVGTVTITASQAGTDSIAPALDVAQILKVVSQNIAPVRLSSLGSKSITREFKSVSYDLSPIFKDSDQVNLDTTLLGANLVLASIQDGKLILTQKESAPYGQDTLFISVYDNYGKMSADTLFLTINRDNRAPVAIQEIKKQEVDLIEVKTFVLSEYFKDLDADLVFKASSSEDSISYRIISGPQNASIKNGILSIQGKQTPQTDTLILGISDQSTEIQQVIVIESGFFKKRPSKNYLGKTWILSDGTLFAETARGTLQVLDVNGLVIVDQWVDRGLHQFNLNLQSGIYYVRVGCSTRKVVKE